MSEQFVLDEKIRAEVEKKLLLLRKREEKQRRIGGAIITLFRSSRLASLDNEIKQIRRDIGGLLIGQFPDNSKDDLVAHCNDVLRRSKDLQSSYVESTVDENQFSYSDEDAHMRAVAPEDTDERKAWFNQFLAIFSGVELDPGWRMTAIDQGCSHGGNTKLFITDDKGRFEEDVFAHMHIVDTTAKSLINVALLDYAITQVRLTWHALYGCRWIVADLRQFFNEYSFYGSDSDGRLLMSHFAEKYCDYDYFYKYDFRPNIVSDDGCSIIRYMTFSPFGGFCENTMVIQPNLHLSSMEKNSDVVIKYDCQIRF